MAIRLYGSSSTMRILFVLLKEELTLKETDFSGSAWFSMKSSNSYVSFNLAPLDGAAPSLCFMTTVRLSKESCDSSFSARSVASTANYLFMLILAYDF